MIERLWLYPPLAFARLGPSPIPCDNYRWGPSDLSPRGTGKTTVVPEETLDVAEDGTVTVRLPDRVRFKDADGFRPVAPFFELYGTWSADGDRHSGPITPAILEGFGIRLDQVRWETRVANLKAYHYTRQDGDRIDARVEFPADDHTRHALQGVSPPGAARPLVPPGAALPLGSVQATRPNAELPGLRLRFTPAKGFVYGPTDLAARTDVYRLPERHLILNPEAAWCAFSLEGDDPRTNPGGLFAGAENNESLGLVDDVCDGVVRCLLPGGLTATARIVVGPPDFAPDRRPFVSIADGLTDRTRRGDVRSPEYLADAEQTALEVRDLLERVLETMDAINIDVQNERAGLENAAIARAQGLPPEAARDQAFPTPEALSGLPLALTGHGRQRHRRLVALEVLEDILRERPDLLRQVLREPATYERFYDRRMPVAMRGSDRYPLHLTRRQYDLLLGWARSLRDGTVAGT
ncbi:hypothetical protein AB0K60_03345 [Thermopolyspora sp. NPDC052614]|uniref:hypothetical protein n=1 Tax=Thermopolyspora sp. NPDC052614 TaxID=3155682 RepID=UPI003415DD01